MRSYTLAVLPFSTFQLMRLCYSVLLWLYYRTVYTVTKVIDFPRYNMKYSEENGILRGISHVVSRFPLHFLFIAEIWIAFLTVYNSLWDCAIPLAKFPYILASEIVLFLWLYSVHITVRRTC